MQISSCFSLCFSSLFLLRYTERVGYHLEPLSSPNQPLGRIGLLTMKRHKEKGNTNVPGAPHEEGTRRTTSNRLEVSFKSNKREPKTQARHKCFLR
jgi:hypothetical protein